jgi:hypothetical protein
MNGCQQVAFFIGRENALINAGGMQTHGQERNDCSDESFGGNVTGVAMKYKLMVLENKCITMERKISSTLRYQFKVLYSA